MTILSLMTISALILVCLSHMAAIRAHRQNTRPRKLVSATVPVRLHIQGRP